MGSSILFSSCHEDRFAQQYAAELARTVAQYRAQIDAKVAAEQQSYVDLAKTYDQAEQSRVENNLDTSRNAAARALCDRVQQAGQSGAGHPFIWSSELNRSLTEFAVATFKTEEKLLSSETDKYQATLGDVDDLQQENQNLKKLQAALESLAHPRTTLDQIKSGAQFGCEVQAKYQAFDLDAQSTALDKQIAAAKDGPAKDALVRQKQSLAEQKASLSQSCESK